MIVFCPCGRQRQSASPLFQSLGLLPTPAHPVRGVLPHQQPGGANVASPVDGCTTEIKVLELEEEHVCLFLWQSTEAASFAKGVMKQAGLRGNSKTTLVWKRKTEQETTEGKKMNDRSEATLCKSLTWSLTSTQRCKH
eukprot:6198634-Pleurochrysis_carterae.AAC.1